MVPLRACGLLLLLGIPACLGHTGSFWGVSLLGCEGRSMRLFVGSRPKPSSSVVRLLDPEGRPHLLKNDSACGTWVAPNPDGSMMASVAFSGCYIRAQEGVYRTTVQIEGRGPDGRMTSYKEELKCPDPLLALDPPDLSLCSSILASDRLLCRGGSSPTVSPGECAELGCCYNPQDRLAPCYYAHKVTVRCTPDATFSIAISKNAARPPLRLDSVRLRSSQGAACAPAAKNEAFVLFRFPLSACGTTFKESGSQWVYENEILAAQVVLASSSGSITRDSSFKLTIRCGYSAEDSLPASVLVAAPPAPAPVAQQGPLALEMRIASDGSYSSYFADSDYPVVKVLRDPVHVEVRLLRRRDPVLMLLLHDCWATPSANPLQRPEWLLLEAGCPYRGDNYQTQLVPIGLGSGLAFPSHVQRFVVSTFTFVDAASQRVLTGPVYFHCSVSACVPSGQETCLNQCEAPAPSWRRSRRVIRSPHPTSQERWTLVTSEGPVEFLGDVVEVSRSDGSSLLQEGNLRWDGTLSLAAGIVAMLSVGTMAAVALRRHWGPGVGLEPAISST